MTSTTAGAHDVVRQNRAFALKTRVIVCGVVCFAFAGVTAHRWSPLHLWVFGLDLVTFFVAWLKEAFAARGCVPVDPG